MNEVVCVRLPLCIVCEAWRGLWLRYLAFLGKFGSLTQAVAFGRGLFGGRSIGGADHLATGAVSRGAFQGPPLRRAVAH